MKNLLFVARVGFITNVCMLLSFMMRYVEVIKDKDLQSTIIIAGFMLSVIFNIIATCWITIFIFTRRAYNIRPLWIFIFNFLCFIFQLYFLLK